jgi:ATP-dependent DNA helicase DinG
MLGNIVGAKTVEEATAWVFSEQGPIRAQGYEVRAAQVSLALAVARRIDAGTGWVIGEAPCGTGKGLAYLIPGIIGAIRAEMAWNQGHRPEGQAAFRKVVVSTANIALQGQLVNKDVPAVARLLGVEVRVSLWKGRNNFLCLDRVGEADQALGFGDRGVHRLVAWTKDPTCTGDKEDLTWDPGWSWGKLSVGSDECHGKKCPHYRPEQGSTTPICYAERARVGVMRAHVVVVNHHLLAVQRPIPAVFLAVDEAHELETCMRSAVSGQVSERGALALAARVEKILGPDEARRVSEPMEHLFATLGAYADGIGARYSAPIPAEWHRGTFSMESLEGLRAVVKLLGKAARQANDESEAGKIEMVSEKVENLYVRAWTIASGMAHPTMGGTAESPWAIWMDLKNEEDPRSGRRTRRITGNMAPADVSAFTMSMQRAYPAALLTSATLAVEHAFTYARLCLGLGALGAPAEFREVEVPDLLGEEGATKKERRQVAAAGPVEELTLPSPYPLETMGALVVPGDCPNPKDPRWEEYAVRRVVEVVKLARGRTLVLCSSVKMMEKYGAALTCSQDQPYPVKVQGQSGRNELIRWFKEETHGVLVGTRSFFQGLDVQGESCSCVIIDRVPFDPPGDPLEEAVGAMMSARAKKPGGSFYLRSLPKACMVLAQGSGRLIRAQTDRGVVVCLDAKVVSGSMADTLRASFPAFPLSRDIQDVANLLEGRPLVGVRHSAPIVASTRITRRGFTNVSP